MFRCKTSCLAPDASNAAIFTSASIADLKRRFVCGEASWLVPVLSWLLCWCWLQLSWPYLRLHAWTSLRSDQILVLVTGCTSKMHISSAKLWFLPGCLGNPTWHCSFSFCVYPGTNEPRSKLPAIDFSIRWNSFLSKLNGITRAQAFHKLRASSCTHKRRASPKLRIFNLNINKVTYNEKGCTT